VPEFVPHFGAAEPVAAALGPLLEEGDARRRQRELFDAIHRAYGGVRFDRAAADVVLREIG
jgi:lipid A disaccharide synthetase